MPHRISSVESVHHAANIPSALPSHEKKTGNTQTGTAVIASREVRSWNAPGPCKGFHRGGRDHGTDFIRYVIIGGTG